MSKYPTEWKVWRQKNVADNTFAVQREVSRGKWESHSEIFRRRALAAEMAERLNQAAQPKADPSASEVVSTGRPVNTAKAIQGREDGTR